MLSVIRRLLGVTVKVSRDDAVQIAKTYCLSKSWPWLEPVHVVLGIRNYEVMTNCSVKGGNVWIRIDCSTGLVTAAGYASR